MDSEDKLESLHKTMDALQDALTAHRKYTKDMEETLLASIWSTRNQIKIEQEKQSNER